MTTGSWSVGDPASHSTLYAGKGWTGTDGKLETWDGGIRVKWNAYQMYHVKWTQDENFDGIPAIPVRTIADFKSLLNWTSNDDLRLLNKLAEQVRGHTFDGGINVAEAGRSYGLIRGNLQSIGSSLINLKRGNISGALRNLGVPKRRQQPLKAKDISGRWLEMQYGWRPLVDQAFEAAKAMEAVTGPRILRFTASSQRTMDYDMGNPAFYNYWVKHRLSVRLRAELYEDVSLARSLGLINPAQVAWEIVPYSFVVDWFLPIGSYLSAFGMIPKLVGRFLTTSMGTIRGARFKKTSPFPLWRPESGYHMKYSAIRYERTPTASLSVPLPTLNRLPRALSPAHLYNAVALIHQKLR